MNTFFKSKVNSCYVCTCRGINFNSYTGTSQLIVFLLHTLFLRNSCHQLSVFPNNSAKICLIKLKIGMLYHMNKTFQNKTFWIFVDVPFNCLTQSQFKRFQNIASFLKMKGEQNKGNMK